MYLLDLAFMNSSTNCSSVFNSEQSVARGFFKYFARQHPCCLVFLQVWAYIKVDFLAYLNHRFLSSYHEDCSLVDVRGEVGILIVIIKHGLSQYCYYSLLVISLLLLRSDISPKKFRKSRIFGSSV